MFFLTRPRLFVGFIVLCLMAGRDLVLRADSGAVAGMADGLAGLACMRWFLWNSLRRSVLHPDLGGAVFGPQSAARTRRPPVGIAGYFRGGHSHRQSHSCIDRQPFNRLTKGQPHNQWQVSQDLREIGGHAGRPSSADWRAVQRWLGKAIAGDHRSGSAARELAGILVRETRGSGASNRDVSRLGVTAIVAEQTPWERGI